MSDDQRVFKLPHDIYTTARERLLSGAGDLPPLWMGQFWNGNIAEFSLGLAKQDVGVSVVDPVQAVCLVSRIHNVPTRRAIEEAAAFRPEARPLLESWRMIWDRSFPDWADDEVDAGVGNERPVSERSLERFDELARHFDRTSNGRRNGLDELINYASSWQAVENALNTPMHDLRDYRLHIIDDAETVVSHRLLKPGFGTLCRQQKLFRLVGHAADGLPIFERFEVDGGRPELNWETLRLKDHPEYWFWPRFQKYMCRRSIYAPNAAFAGALIADMAWQGHSHAFIKGAAGKSGTWTVDLSRVRTMDDGINALKALIGPNANGRGFGLIVQEHVPFTHEQRLFIIDGKLIASVASDRHFCVSDTRRNRRLDDRLAVLHKPSINCGEYDRGDTGHVVDRKTAADFARLARNIARDLREDGHLNYVIDLGLTDRGITAVEINTVHFAGPYCMEKQWIMKAYDRLRQKMQASLDHAVEAYYHSRIEDPMVLRLADKYNTDQFTQIALADAIQGRRLEEFEFQKDHVADRLLVKAIIASKIKESINAG